MLAGCLLAGTASPSPGSRGRSTVPATGVALWQAVMAQPWGCSSGRELLPLLVEVPNEAPAIGGEGVFAEDHIRAVASDPPPVHAKGGIGL